MSQTLKQITDANPITSVLTTDLFYLSRSPYSSGLDRGISATNLFASPLPIGLTTPSTGKFTSVTSDTYSPLVDGDTVNMPYGFTFTNPLGEGTFSGVAFVASGSVQTPIVNTHTASSTLLIQNGNGPINSNGNIENETGLFTFASGINYKANTVSSMVTLDDTYFIVNVDTSGGAASITLPASPANGKTYPIKDISGNASSNNITINGNGHNIDDASTLVLSNNYDGVVLSYSLTQTKWVVNSNYNTAASSGYLLAANNLSDLTNFPNARNNLRLGLGYLSSVANADIVLTNPCPTWIEINDNVPINITFPVMNSTTPNSKSLTSGQAIKVINYGTATVTLKYSDGSSIINGVINAGQEINMVFIDNASAAGIFNVDVSSFTNYGYLLNSNNLSDVSSTKTSLQNIGLGAAPLSFSQGTNRVLTNPCPTIISAAFTAGSLSMNMPVANAANSLNSSGDAHCTIYNNGSNAFKIWAQDGSTSLVNSLLPGQTVTLWPTANSTANGSWFVGPILGNMSQQSSNNISITGGAMDGVQIGLVTPNTAVTFYKTVGKISSDSILATDTFNFVNTSGGSYTYTLVASPTSGQTHIFKDDSGNAATNNIIINGNGNNIDGSSTYTINVNKASITMIYNGTQWNIV